jgi:hypothetical protein
MQARDSVHQNVQSIAKKVTFDLKNIAQSSKSIIGDVCGIKRGRGRPKKNDADLLHPRR